MFLQVSGFMKRYLRIERCRWLELCQFPWQHVHGSPVQPKTTICRGWELGQICDCGSDGNCAYQLCRSIRDGIYHSWFCDDAYHQRYHDLQDAYGAYLKSKARICVSVNITLQIECKFKFFNSPIRPCPWLTWPRSFLVFFLFMRDW